MVWSTMIVIQSWYTLMGLVYHLQACLLRQVLVSIGVLMTLEMLLFMFLVLQQITELGCMQHYGLLYMLLQEFVYAFSLTLHMSFTLYVTGLLHALHKDGNVAMLIF